MEQPPEDKKLEEILRSSKIVAAGFMGDDLRTVEEIIDADATTLRELGKTCKQVAERMQELTDAGQKGWGTAHRKICTVVGPIHTLYCRTWLLSGYRFCLPP